MKRKIHLFGRLRDAGLGDLVSLNLPERATARQALDTLKTALGRRSALLSGCALATNDSVLRPSDVVPKTGPLAVLPPVCGG
ncbi:MAG: MoaD/ThiS family protein [Elusimicrobia bacterium]|nr:MoaD/ThiS family protein [Elusimicrobiota bacterium]